MEEEIEQLMLALSEITKEKDGLILETAKLKIQVITFMLGAPWLILDESQSQNNFWPAYNVIFLCINDTMNLHERLCAKTFTCCDIPNTTSPNCPDVLNLHSACFSLLHSNNIELKSRDHCTHNISPCVVICQTFSKLNAKRIELSVFWRQREENFILNF